MIWLNADGRRASLSPRSARSSQQRWSAAVVSATPRRSELQREIDVVRQEGWIEENIDKARSGDFDFIGNAVQIEMRQYLLCKLSRRHAQFFGHRHHAIGLIVAELNFC